MKHNQLEQQLLEQQKLLEGFTAEENNNNQEIISGQQNQQINEQDSGIESLDNISENNDIKIEQLNQQRVYKIKKEEEELRQQQKKEDEIKKQKKEEADRIKQKKEEELRQQQKKEDEIKKQKKEDADKLAAEALRELLKETTYRDKSKKIKINSIIKNTTTLEEKDIKQLSNDEKILLLSKIPLEDARYEALKGDKTIKFDNSLTSIKALLKKNNGSYKEVIDYLEKLETVNNNSFIKRIFGTKSTDSKELETLKKDKELKESIISKVSEPEKYSTITEASEVAFSLLSDKPIAQENKKEQTKETVKIISSLIGKSKNKDGNSIKEKEITAPDILSNTVTINDRRLKLLGYVYKNNTYEIGTTDEILGNNNNIVTLEEKKKFIKAVGYKFSFEISDQQVEQDIEDLAKLGWTIDPTTKLASFKKPDSYSDKGKKILNEFINRSLNAIEVSKSASAEALGKQPDNNIKTKLGVHKILGLNDKQNDKQK